MKRFRAVLPFSVTFLALHVAVLVSCASTSGLPKSPAALRPDEGIVVFPIVVTEEYVNGSALFADRHGPTSSLKIVHDTLTETTNASFLGLGSITGPKSFSMYPGRKHRAMPAGYYETLTIDFGGAMFFMLDKEGKGRDMSYAFTAEAGKVNYWGRCLVKIRQDLKARTLTLVSLEIVDMSGEDLAEFAAKAPAYAALPRAVSVGRSLAGR
jgi:hypothetical protein